jgi:hypothetical protein
MPKKKPASEPSPTSKKLVVEHSHDGRIYIYIESLEHFAFVERHRSRSMTKLTLDSLANECLAEPGSYLVVDIP